ncbi:phosphatase PAP2 family protein [Rhodoferax sp.]|uniref:phosphatase PAP2 family protein n=1 Tax=Rhodoferax sp. TaxID=50421 RepID=UPI0025DAAF04|nr:phosphatase PAP2 family protein [Rhodoferax sp.]
MPFDAESWAAWAGQHALPIFGGLLVVLLLSTGVAWWGLRRMHVPREHSSLSPPLYLGVRLAAGFAVIVAAAWVFAELAEKLGTDGTMGRADQALADSLRTQLPLAALQGFALLTRLADTATVTGLCILVAVLLVWRGRRWLALGWVLAVAGNGVLNTTLKQIFARVRPVHDDGLVVAHGFSFPSGHSSGSVVLYGMLAYVLCRFVPPRWHFPLVLAAVALAFSVGVSRVFLRVHFASDVLAGFASGTAWLVVCITSIGLTRWMYPQPGIYKK